MIRDCLAKRSSGKRKRVVKLLAVGGILQLPKLMYTSQSYGCDWIATHYEIISGQAISIMRRMEGEIAPLIRPFPERLYEEVEKSKVAVQVRFLADVTMQIVKLLSDVDKWDTQDLDNLQNVLATRQLVQLKRCAVAYPASRKTSSKLRKHFRTLRNILKNANYSEASWEQVRAIVKNHLLRMDIIAGNLRRQFRS